MTNDPRGINALTPLHVVQMLTPSQNLNSPTPTCTYVCTMLLCTLSQLEDWLKRLFQTIIMYLTGLLLLLHLRTSFTETFTMGYLTGSQRRAGDLEYPRPGLQISGAISLAVEEVSCRTRNADPEWFIRFAGE